MKDLSPEPLEPAADRPEGQAASNAQPAAKPVVANPSKASSPEPPGPAADRPEGQAPSTAQPAAEPVVANPSQAPSPEPPEPAADRPEGQAASNAQPAAKPVVANPSKAPPAANLASAAPPAGKPNTASAPPAGKPNTASAPPAGQPNTASAPPAGKPNTASPSGPRRSLWRRGRFWVVALIIAAALAATLWFTVLRPPLVSVAEVTRASVTAEIEGTGTVTVEVLTKISSKITGRVEQVFVTESDAVQANQILATLDRASLAWEVERARARLFGATTSAQQREREWNRESTLVASGAVSLEEAQQYEERNAVAKSVVEATTSELRNAEYNLSLTQIPSLSSGVVTTRWVVPGASVVPGQPMFTVADTSLIYVDAYIDQSSSGKIRKGQVATVILRGREDHPVPGYVLRIKPQADQATEEMVAEVAFTVPREDFQLGQWANVYIQVGEAANALTIPRTALMPMENDIFVLVVGAKETIRREPITVLADSPRAPTVAISGNLQPGDRVVLMPMGLQPGQAIRPVLAKEGHAMGRMP